MNTSDQEKLEKAQIIHNDISLSNAMKWRRAINLSGIKPGDTVKWGPAEYTFKKVAKGGRLCLIPKAGGRQISNVSIIGCTFNGKSFLEPK